MQPHRHRAALLAGLGDFGRIPVLVVPSRAQLHRDRQRPHRLHHLAHRALDRRRILEHGGAGPVAADLLHRAAHVDVHRVDRPVLLHRHAGAFRQHIGVVAEHLDGERPLRLGPLQVAEGLVAAVHQPVAADHFGVGDGGAQLPAEQPERPVGDPRERREKVAVGEHQRPQPHRLDGPCGSGGRQWSLAAGGEGRVLVEGSNRHPQAISRSSRLGQGRMRRAG